MENTNQENIDERIGTLPQLLACCRQSPAFKPLFLKTSVLIFAVALSSAALASRSHEEMAGLYMILGFLLSLVVFPLLLVVGLVGKSKIRLRMKLAAYLLAFVFVFLFALGSLLVQSLLLNSF